MSDIGQFSSFFLSGHLTDVDPNLYTSKKLSAEEVQRCLVWGMWSLDELTDWNLDSVTAALRGCAQDSGVKLRDFLAPFYPALKKVWAIANCTCGACLLDKRVTSN